MGTAIEVFWGNEPEVRSAREFVSQLVSDLKSRNIAVTIMAALLPVARTGPGR